MFFKCFKLKKGKDKNLPGLFSKRLEKEIRKANIKLKQSYSNIYGMEYFVRLNSRGQLLRGTLALIGYHLCTDNPNIESVLPLAVALEFCQTAMLIQDDIIDHDFERRGYSTLHIGIGRQRGFPLRGEAGIAEEAASLIGNIGISYAINYIQNSYESEMLEKINADLYEMLSNTIIGEILDTNLPIETVLNTEWAQEMEGTNAWIDVAIEISKRKTADYSFARPLIMGAKLAGEKENYIELFQKIGTELGIAYQLLNDRKALKKMQKEHKIVSDLKYFRLTYPNALVLESNDTELIALLLKEAKTEQDEKDIFEKYPFENVLKETEKKEEEILNDACGKIEESEMGNSQKEIFKDCIRYFFK